MAFVRLIIEVVVVDKLCEVAVDEFAEFCVSSTSPLPSTTLPMMLMTMISVSWHA